MKTLTDSELRVAVAEAMGWSIVKNYGNSGMYGYPRRTPSYDMAECPPGTIPNYPASLDACAEFEGMMTHEQKQQYAMALHEMHGIPLATFWYRVTCSTPRQRCLAYLATVAPEKLK